MLFALIGLSMQTFLPDISLNKILRLTLPEHSSGLVLEKSFKLSNPGNSNVGSTISSTPSPVQIAKTNPNSIAGGQSNSRSSYNVYNIYSYNKYPVYRLPVSTRPPNVPHHYKIETNPYYKPGNVHDNIVHHEIREGSHKITSKYETYEYQYSVQQKPTILSFLRQ